MTSKLFRLLRALLLAYLALCVLVAVFQRSLIYFPFHPSETKLVAEADRLGLRGRRDVSGTIFAWDRATRSAPAVHRLLVFHGNTGYALQRPHFIEGFEGLDGGRTWEVILFEFPGYGARPGRPSEASFIAAGLEAVEALTRDDPRPLYLVGESLGSGLASALAQRVPEKIAGVYLHTPFARIGDVAAHHYGFLPVRLILRDRWDNVAALEKYRGPLAVLVADEDEVVTAPQGRLVFERYAGPKRLWRLPDTQHNTIDFRPEASWWREVSEFLLAPASGELNNPLTKSRQPAARAADAALPRPE